MLLAVLSRLIFYGRRRSIHSSSVPSSPLALHRLLSNPPTDFPDLSRTHSLVITSGHSSNPFFAAKLISLYAAFSRPSISSWVFLEAIRHQPGDTFLWNSIIKSHFSNDDFPQSLHLYCQMHASGAKPNHFTVPLVASACAEMLESEAGSCIHGASIKFGFFGHGSAGVGSSLVYMYSKCGAIGQALTLFEEMPERDVVSWTAIIMGCVRNEKCELALACLEDMHRSGEIPNSWTIAGGLQACRNLGALTEGKCLHAFAMKSGLWCCDFVKSSTLSVYSKCESLEDASVVFHELPVKDVISWTEILGNYARKGLLVESLALFDVMLASGVYPDGVSISCLLMALANFGDIRGGKAFHGFVLRRNFVLDAPLVNSLLAMYCKFEHLHAAKMLFGMTEEKDVESWTLMLTGCGRMGLNAECMNLFRKMQLLGLRFEADPDGIIAVISSCSRSGALQLGQSVHCYAIKNKLDAETTVLNSLVDMYGRGMKLDYCRGIFDRMRRDVITWNTLIAAYAHAGRSNDALTLFSQMFSENMKPNSTTLIIALSACSNVAALHQGEWIHNYIIENGFEWGVSLSTALVDMYAKCGQLELARSIFDSMEERDVVTWNVMISAYGSHGRAKEALHMFKEMEEMSVVPNGVTFLTALSSCSHAGFIEEGKYLFSRMRDHSITPTCKHYACMVDLFGRSGRLKEAEEMVLTMPTTPDGGVWGALLSACKIHNNLEMGERAGKKALELEPDNDGYYILLSNLYCCAGRREDAERLREVMTSRGLRKTAGWSLMELDEKFYVFVVEDKSHPQFEEMHWLLEFFLKHMEEWCHVA
uniref:Pentatricopeptide repeat-containing protein At4g39952, mitochondrial n=1 Tax=Anthurium amnicola TaxID=1678845 RepID=A0A1D1Z9Y1_9ARAE